MVLHALTIVIKQFPNIRFFIAGDGPHKKSLQELVTNLKLQNNVVFVGFVSEDEKQKLLAESNALLFPSTTEGFGLVILEAFQQKKPALVSNIPPMSDIIQHENTGFVIEPHDKKTWAQSIIRLIEDPDLSKNMGNNGNQILKTKYNQELFY